MGDNNRMKHLSPVEDWGKPPRAVEWYLLIREAEEFTNRSGFGLAGLWEHVYKDDYDRARKFLDEGIDAYFEAPEHHPSNADLAKLGRRISGGEWLFGDCDKAFEGWWTAKRVYEVWKVWSDRHNDYRRPPLPPCELVAEAFEAGYEAGRSQQRNDPQPEPGARAKVTDG